ncbi:MAG: hypothetical protein IPK26_11515 [Planctomycetes bacterium]|nr:hypothetical protein [Planctomycetota bacterium]
MLIKPVYVVEQKEPLTTRRALLMAAVAGLAGITIGCAAGVIIGRETTVEAAENPRLVRAHQLATQADQQELLAEAAFFLAVVQEQGHRAAIDATLWSGCGKLADAVLTTDGNRVVGDALLSLKHYPHPTEFAKWIPELDRFVRARRHK